jgi:hypothetical protein
VDLRRILDNHQLEGGDVEAQLLACPGPVLQQSFPEIGVDPGTCHHLGAALGRALTHVLDLGVDLLVGQNALLDQKLAQADLHQLEVRERPVFALVVHAGSSQC